MQGDWRTEFGEDYDVPSEVEELVRDGVLTDVSWHNDACPRFAVNSDSGMVFTVFASVDHPDPRKREFLVPRFAVTRDEEDGEVVDLSTTDDVHELTAFLKGVTA